MPSPTFQQITASRLLVLTAAIVFGAVCTHWVLQLRGGLPGSSPPRQAVAAAPVAVIDAASLHLFGVNGASTEVTAAPPPNVRLIGLIAADPHRSAVALLVVDGKANPFRRGDVVAPGMMLQDIRRDGVTLDLNGQVVEVPLVAPGGAVPPAAAPTTAGQAAGPGILPAATAVPPFKLEVQSLGPNHFGISKGELNRALQDPRLAGSMGKVTANPGTGLALEDVPAGSLSDRLGLKPGDVLRSANGQALTTLGDLPRLYQEFGTSTAVRLEIIRAGQPTTLQYSVRP